MWPLPMMLLVQVEDAVLDTYDLVYDQAMTRPSSSWWQELATIQDTVSQGQGGHTCAPENGCLMSSRISHPVQASREGPRTAVPLWVDD